MKCKKIAKTSHPISKCRIWMVFSPLFALSVIRQFLHHSHHIFPTAIFFALSWRFCVKKHRACSWGESKGRKGRKRDMGFLCKNHAMLYSKELNNIWKITKNVLHFKNYQKYLTFQKLPKMSHIKKITKNIAYLFFKNYQKYLRSKVLIFQKFEFSRQKWQKFHL